MIIRLPNLKRSNRPLVRYFSWLNWWEKAAAIWLVVLYTSWIYFLIGFLW